LNVVFGQGELPFEDSQVFAVYKFFHRRGARSGW
jgi:hypothetical protein